MPSAFVLLLLRRLQQVTDEEERAKLTQVRLGRGDGGSKC